MAKGRPRSFDTNEALDKALHLFWAHGYEGTSISMLAKEIGVNVPSLYAAFGNKEAIYMKAAERYGELNGGMYHNSLPLPTAYEVVKAVLEGEVELVTRDICPGGCFMVQSALITSPESEELRKTMAAIRRTPEQWLKDRFVRAKKEGDLPADSDPAALALYIMTLNCGIAVMGKSGATKTQLMKVVKTALESFPGKPPPK